MIFFVEGPPCGSVFPVFPVFSMPELVDAPGAFISVLAIPRLPVVGVGFVVLSFIISEERWINLSQAKRALANSYASHPKSLLGREHGAKHYRP
jgi:hypothetical protein